MIASFMSVSLLLLISYCFLLPPAMTGYQILWVMWVIIPLLILSYFFSPHEPDTMTMMPSKCLNSCDASWIGVSLIFRRKYES